MRLIRAIFRLAALVWFTFACVAVHVLSQRLAGRSRWPRRFLGGAARVAGFDVHIAGKPLSTDVFFVANHLSWADIFLMGGATGCAFVARDDVGRWPVIGWLAAQNSTIMVSRTGRSSVDGQIGTIRKAMLRHQPVALFPEGTTGNGEALLPFKPALFAVLLPPPRAIQVQPVVIDYGAAAPDIAWTGSESAGANLLRVLGRRGRTPVTLHFLDPFAPGEHPDRKALAALAQARIAAALRGLRAGAGPV